MHFTRSMKPLLVLCALTATAAAQPAEIVLSVPPGPVIIVVVPGAASAPPATAVAQPPIAPFAPPGAGRPVGSHRSKARARRRAAIGVNPVGWLMNTYGASAWLALGEHSAVRIDGTVFSWGDQYESYEAELTLPLYPVRTFQGPFLEPGLSLRRTRGNPFVSTLEDPPSLPSARQLRGATLMFGWHWLLGERAHVAAAFGFAVLDESGARDEERESIANGYLRMGVTF